MDTLSRYVEDGGDMPSAWYDEFTALMSTDRGTPFEKPFGATIDGYQYAGTNRPGHLGELEFNGFTVDLTPQNRQTAMFCP
jgi:beta-galactosidase